MRVLTPPVTLLQQNAGKLALRWVRLHHEMHGADSEGGGGAAGNANKSGERDGVNGIGIGIGSGSGSGNGNTPCGVAGVAAGIVSVDKTRRRMDLSIKRLSVLAGCSEKATTRFLREQGSTNLPTYLVRAGFKLVQVCTVCVCLCVCVCVCACMYVCVWVCMCTPAV